MFRLVQRNLSMIMSLHLRCPLNRFCGTPHPLRMISTSIICSKKRGKKPTITEEEKIKKEAPFFYKALKTTKKNTADFKKLIELQPPVLFQPIRAKSEDVDDDHTILFNEFKKKSLKKENVFVLQPNFKWGKERFLTQLEEKRLEEATALVKSMENWNIHSTQIESIHDVNPKLFFGSGKVVELAEHIRELVNNDGVTMVFLNTSKLTSRQIKELETAWGCKVFDRYRVVLELFKERANTKEAKLQVQLAEIHYLRSHLTAEDLSYDQQRGGGKGIFGGGETQLDKAKKVLSTSEAKIKKSLQHIKVHRQQARNERIKNKIPHVALVGYTNSGKTSLAKVLSHDHNMTPENKLFATLDTTAHGGKLPCGLNLVYIDTVGFISDLPHDLVESFSTTLEDVRTADLLLHVSDISHPEYELQHKTVNEVLQKLDLPDNLIKTMLHVNNKVDLVNESSPSYSYIRNDALSISATMELGIATLKELIEDEVLRTTGRRKVKLNIDQQGGELSWFYRHGTVIGTSAKDDGSLDVISLLDADGIARFQNEFRRSLEEL